MNLQRQRQNSNTPTIQGSFYSYVKHAFQSTFQSLELCNETICHNKVPNKFDFFRYIPYGKKAFVWFHYNYRKNIPECHFFELDHKTKSIQTIYNFRVCYHPYLTSNKGTLLYGTLQIDDGNKSNIFYIEDCLHMNTYNCAHDSWKQKYTKHFPSILHNIKPVVYSNIDIQFQLLPIYTKNEVVPQNSIYSIQFLRENLIFTVLMNKYKDGIQSFLKNIASGENVIPKIENKPKTEPRTNTKQHITFRKTFKIRPCIQCDIYEAYCKDEELVGTLCIPNYTTSVMMNSYFRNIQENNNLDALEESDDEDTFQNIDITKFVKLNAEEYFECEYNNVFKMWVPVQYKDKNTVCDNDLPSIQSIYSFYASLRKSSNPTMNTTKKQYTSNKKNIKYLPKNYTEKSFKQTFCTPKHKK